MSPQLKHLFLKQETKTLIGLLSTGVTAGFIVGLVFSLRSILSNNYIQYRMTRLSAISLRSSINGYSLIVTGGLCLVFVILKLIPKIIKINKRVAVLLTAIGLMLFGAEWFLRKYTVYTMFSIPKKTFNRLTQLVTGEISTGYFLSLIKTHIPAIIILTTAILLMAVFFTLLIKTHWKNQSVTYGLDKIDLIFGGNRIKIIALSVIILVLILNLSAFFMVRKNSSRGPNVVLMIVDALRKDALGCYNQKATNSPNIDKFARKAILFKKAIAQSPGTINSAPSIFCSVYPSEHGYFNYEISISERLNTLAEYLMNKGYTTFGISTNPHVTQSNGLSQGFDTFMEDLSWKNTRCSEVNQRFRDWLDRTRPSKFFAMLWYIDPHQPYAPPEAYLDKYIKESDRKLVSDITARAKIPERHLTDKEKKVSKKLYEGEVNFFDTEFSNLMNYFDERGLMENTVIVLTSDHGEAFWENKDIFGNELAGHGTSLYEVQLDIPLIIFDPLRSQTKVIDEIVQHIDIVPTILDLIEDRPMMNRRKSFFRGSSLVDLIDGASLNRKYALSENITDQYGTYHMRCLQTDDFKLILTRSYKDENFKKPHLQLLDLRLNTSGASILAEGPDSVFKDLRHQLLVWENVLDKAEAHGQFAKHKRKEIDEKQKQRLKALGYIKD